MADQIELTVDQRDGRVWPRCHKCNVIWRQSGNRTGHCSACHRTFDGVEAFDRHQTTHNGVVTCHDPLAHQTVNYTIRFGEGPYDKDLIYYRIDWDSSVFGGD